jgi:hypothetical protein
MSTDVNLPGSGTWQARSRCGVHREYIRSYIGGDMEEIRYMLGITQVYVRYNLAINANQEFNFPAIKRLGFK